MHRTAGTQRQISKEHYVPKLVITHKVVDVDKWLKGKSERAESISGMGGSNVVDHVAQEGRKYMAITCEKDEVAGREGRQPKHDPIRAEMNDRVGKAKGDVEPREDQNAGIYPAGHVAGQTANVEQHRHLEQVHEATVDDDDVVRTPLSKGLAFSPEDRDTNLQRIGGVSRRSPRPGRRASVSASPTYDADTEPPP